MNFSIEDIESYAVGLGLALGIYGIMNVVIPKLFSKLMPTKASKVVSNITVATQSIIKPKFIFPFETREVKGEEALASFEATKSAGKSVPIIIAGDHKMVQSLADMMAYRKPTAAEYISRAEARPEPYPTKTTPKMPKTWPQVGPFNTDRDPFLLQNYPNGFKPIVTIATIPADSSADIPAHLKLGGWNAVPEADVFVALLRKWQRNYGAELVAISMDTIELRVARKPTTKEQALLLAREHAKFCPSSEATIAERAAELMQLEWWHFWWD